MRHILGLAWTMVALAYGAGLATAQWNLVEQQEVKPNAFVGQFGRSIAISGDTALVAASTTAHVFDIDPDSGIWTDTALLVGSTLIGSRGVDLSGDTAVIGAPDGAVIPPQEGEVHVFERDSIGTWTLTAILLSPQAVLDFGEGVAISGDTIVTSCRGAACVFERNLGGPGAWGLAAVLSDTDSEESFGSEVDVDGDLIVVGAAEYELGGEQIGAAFVFQRSSAGGAWNHVGTLLGSDSADGDYYGLAVAISGDTILVGAPFADPGGLQQDGAAYVYERIGNQWQELAKLTLGGLSNLFGSSVALHADTAVVATNAYEEANAFAVFKRNQGGVNAWQAVAELPTPGGFQSAVAVSGSVVAVDEASPVTPVGTNGLAFDSAGGVLYAVGGHYPINTQYLWIVDPDTAGATPVGPLDVEVAAGLAFDPATRVLYCVDWFLDLVFRIDPATGATTAIGPPGFGTVDALDFDPLTSVLYGVDNPTNQLLTIDVQSGAATAVGPVGLGVVSGLAFDTTTGLLYGNGWGGTNDKLFTIDPQTGAGALIGSMGFFTVQGLAMDSSTGTLYGVDSNRLFRIDPQTGAGTVIGKLSVPGTGNEVHVFEVSHGSETYCTAGTSASGCAALIAASGQGSASAPSGFVVSASGVEGGMDGLFIFGSHGKQTNPWGNGTSYQCVVPPVNRTGILAGTGTAGFCDGSFARDLNAAWCPSCPGSGANPGAGATVQTQLWYRDPLSTSNQTTSLSDAIEFVLAP